ncbi:alpha-galactosidase [Lacticaseibacillus paracasei]|nr:alpha-galactosidase [Lacticaseibacillus paracasei]AYG23186.1 alpha-galactosidase [Lacticaseibacillus paracasei]MCT3336215.1 alpha-galactosidase [Lacticaseibacillus paracasei]PCL23437.1 alpha-galactosidase [Lacticaseibacillus paracasei]PCL34324.1 alpha-galactosidase [Lacticaseibacillus paracasei]
MLGLLSITRSPSQKPTHKNLEPKWPFRFEATYAPVSKRAGSRSLRL